MPVPLGSLCGKPDTQRPGGLGLQVRDRHSRLLQDHHERFHAVWGQLLKTGYQNSRFGHQVERFACLYTSHVSNLCFYSPDKSYR